MNTKNQTKIIPTAVVGGGASGLMLAAFLSENGEHTVLFERGERVGKKLSATGNGQGNVTNRNVLSGAYFSSEKSGAIRAQNAVAAYNNDALFADFEKLGLLLAYDERGRAYPAGRQASALTDALRFYLTEKGVETHLSSKVLSLEKQGGMFALTVETPEGKRTFFAENVVLCTGGKAAKNFGTDGSAYALAKTFGHSVTPLFPSLVQLKTDASKTKTLKGIRVADAGVTALWREKSEEHTFSLQGDVIFTDYGVSGDAVFRVSAFVTDKIADGVNLFLDFLPAFEEEKIYNALQRKRAAFPDLPFAELLGGIVNNQVGRAVMKSVPQGDLRKAAQTVKKFPLAVTGTLGFDYAQVTKGGIPLSETDENLQSKFAEGLYFAGEILDVDGQCGGFNLQWAYSSARTVATAIQAKTAKTRGQV